MSYQYQSVNAVQENNSCLLSESYGEHNKYTVWAECRAFSVKPDGIYCDHYHLRNTGTLLLKLKDDMDCAVQICELKFRN